MMLLSVKLLFTAIILYAVFINIELKALWMAMLQANLQLMVVAVFFYTMNFVIGGVRWYGINKALGLGSSLNFCIRIFFVGGFFSQFLVGGGYGGDVYRIWVLVRRTGQRLTSFMTVFIDRASGFVGAIIVIVSLTPVYLFLYPNQKQILAAISMGCAIVLVLLILMAWVGRYRVLRGGWGGDLVRSLFLRLNDVSHNLAEGFLSWPATGIHLGWSLITLLFNLFAMAAIGGALGLSIDFWVFLTLGPIVFLAKSFPLSFAGWGAREVAMIYFFGFVNVDNASAVAMSLMAGGLVLISSLPGAILWLMNKDLRATQPHAIE
jgi:glycosyltransferase 2 family protein